MRSRELALEKYNTDKITHRYLEWYDPVLEHFVPKEIKLLELGIYDGGSLLLWRDYFPKGRIVGIDIQVKVNLSGEERVRVFQGSQQDTTFLSEVARETAPEGFDIIIDDASHFGNLTKIAFWHLFDNHLKPSGLNVIEDWGTGYWSDWPDGKIYRPRSIRPTGSNEVGCKFDLVEPIAFLVDQRSDLFLYEISIHMLLLLRRERGDPLWAYVKELQFQRDRLNPRCQC